MPLLTPTPSGRPAVGLVTSLGDWRRTQLVNSFALELGVRRAAARPFTVADGPRSPQSVLVINENLPPGEVEGEARDICAALGVDFDALPLRIGGWNGAPGGFERVSRAREAINADVIIFAAAATTEGVGLCHDGRVAWGRRGAWGPGRTMGPLGGQVTHAGEWGVEFINFMNFTASTYSDKPDFCTNADWVSELCAVEAEDDDPVSLFLTEAGHDTKLVRPAGAALWQFAYREPTRP